MDSREPHASFVDDGGREGAGPVDYTTGSGSVSSCPEQSRKRHLIRLPGAIACDGEAPRNVVVIGGAEVDFSVGLIVVEQIGGASNEVVLQSERARASRIRKRVEAGIGE